MKTTRASTVALAVGCLLAVFAGPALALPLPDSSSCNKSGMACLNISNTSTGGNAGAISATVEIGTAIGAIAHGPSWAIVGSADQGYGVMGVSNTSTGVRGASSTGDGIEGISQTSGKSALFAHNEAANGGFGVWAGTKGSGQAIHGENPNSSGWAGYFHGKVIGTSFSNFSDARLKQNVAPLPYGTNDVMKLRPVTYEWKDAAARGDRRQLGLIAQEVRAIVPELVSSDGASGMLSVDYTALTPILIKAVQEQQHALQAQQAQLREQAARIAALESRQRPLAAASLLGGDLGNAGALALAALPIGLFLSLRPRRRQA